MDSANHFSVGVNGERIVIMRPVTMLGISKADACNLAAWLTVLADPDGTEVPKMVAEIKKS